MRTTLTFGDHVSEDRLEEYCLGKVPAAELDELEDHLLICPPCQVRLREADQYVRTMRLAITALADLPPEKPGFWSRLVSWMIRPVPMLACTGTAAIILALAIAPPFGRSGNAGPVAVRLESLRGEGETLHARAPQHTPLVLTLDLTGLRQEPSYRVRIVDAGGRMIGETSAQPRGGSVRLETPARLSHGLYWIRIYDRAASPTLVREYGLELE